MQKFFKNKKKGFTLVETLVAISIFSISILGVLSVMASSISNTIYAKDKMTAGYLAQEGLEYMRNLRDTYVLYDPTGNQGGWNNFEAHVGLTGSTLCAKSMVNGCYIGDLTSASFSGYNNPPVTPLMEPIINVPISACNDNTCSTHPLYYNSSTGIYGYTTGGINSGFTRQIIISPVGVTGNEVNVTSAVYWKQGSGTYNITLSENLYNWVTQYYQ